MTIVELEDPRRVDPTDVHEYAVMLAARIDGAYMIRWLSTKDDYERELLQRMAEDIIKQRETIHQNLAVQIANEVGKLFSK